jgi:hypothetical protein
MDQVAPATGNSLHGRLLLELRGPTGLADSGRLSVERERRCFFLGAAAKLLRLHHSGPSVRLRFSLRFCMFLEAGGDGAAEKRLLNASDAKEPVP